MKSDILLESGTGELEILEFVIGNKHYAINVIKVREVLEVENGNITPIPETNPAIAGLILCRQEIITLVDLKYVVLGEEKIKNWKKIIVCEFNKIKVAFNIDYIVGVHRIRWDEILKPDAITENSLVIGNIISGDNIILMLDFEKIVTDISPKTGISEDRIVNVEYRDRSNIHLLLADDSPLIRRLLRDTLTKAGFKNIITFDDGSQLLTYLKGIEASKGDKLHEDVDVIITDIEMPVMDGHTLTRKIKEDPVLRNLPVIIFSSLITDDLKHKGESVGADAQLSKPEIGELIDVVDKLIESKNL
ncbi:chemotaxis protein CheV [Clostridium sp. 19966]|uniref:chemotaxis protein n=1 Tax=Clostridium sp. 19966 TaxID=2768166 RepID=UPI0028DEF344|nr:chemotaxis protein [Clostridium sp. 19966]MDT8715174.1 chemotaxis protein CheV [Clostridium sp. 19966]